jgi:hypothetical protein
MFKLFEVFWKGKELANSATWKKSGIAVTALVPVMAYALSLTELEISTEELTTIALGIIAIVNIFLPFATSKKIGFPEGENK